MNEAHWLASQIQIRPNMHYAAALNVERVRSYLESHLGCTAKEAAYALGLSEHQAARAVRKIREEWCRNG